MPDWLLQSVDGVYIESKLGFPGEPEEGERDMNVFWGFEYDTEFYKIGDEIDVVFHNGTHYSGTLEDLRVDDGEIVVNGCAFSLYEIDKVIHLN